MVSHAPWSLARVSRATSPALTAAALLEPMGLLGTNTEFSLVKLGSVSDGLAICIAEVTSGFETAGLFPNSCTCVNMC